MSLSGTTVDQVLVELFRRSESRGKEASGVAFQDEQSIRVLKAPVRASILLSSAEYRSLLRGALYGDPECPKNRDGGGRLLGRSRPLQDAPIAVIGHTRLMTNGRREALDNNHPVVAGGIACVHNGIIVNDTDLWRRHPELERRSEVDTEIIPSLTRKFLDSGSALTSAVSRTFDMLEGTASIAMLFEDRDALVLATNNGSLYFARSHDADCMIFASERHILEAILRRSDLQRAFRAREPAHLEPGSGCLVRTSDLSIRAFRLSPSAGDSVAVRARPRPLHLVATALSERSPSNNGERKVDRHPARPAQLVIPRETFTWNDDLPPLVRCKRCVLPESMPFLELDDEGVCRYCRTRGPYPVKGAKELMRLADEIRSSSGRIDCVVAYSGGRDSSYCLHYVKRVLGLHPIAFTYDWGMVTDLARRNTARLCGKLGVEHIVISADINQKRENIRKNVDAWLKKPDIGVIPLFMAGDKMFFYHADRLRRKLGVRTVFFGHNELEHEDFKVGFCGLRTEMRKEPPFFALTPFEQLRLALYYGWQFLRNPAYLNGSIPDTAFAFYCYYLMSHDFYLNFYSYVKWNEREIVATLKDEYDWELATDTTTSWRIGDGTAAFYNYIYQTVTGFSEHDSFRSNQIREGMLTREQALELVEREGRARHESLREYLDLIGIDYRHAMNVIHGIPKLYETRAHHAHSRTLEPTSLTG